MKWAIVLVMITLGGYGQTSPEGPRYDVVSIKPDLDNDFPFTFRDDRL